MGFLSSIIGFGASEIETQSITSVWQAAHNNNNNNNVLKVSRLLIKKAYVL